jgi:hypothetical protein
MEKVLGKIETVVAFACSATIAALSIGYIAIDELGISPEEIRFVALLCAGVVGSNIVIEAFGKARKSK